MSRSFTHLSLKERRTIARMHEQQMSRSAIALHIGRDRATVCREIKRNFWHDTEVPEATGYWALTAHDIARDRRRRTGKLYRCKRLQISVVDKLKDGWSPEQIAGRLNIEPDRSARLCHETIYRYIYSQNGQRQGLAQYLPERRPKRRPRYARKPRNPVFPADRSISCRPVSVNQREQFGHWEADLMIFRREYGEANVATVVERKSRFTLLFSNNDRRSKPIMDRLIKELSPLPQPARQSLTFDRGFEFLAWRRLEKRHGHHSLVL